MDVAFLVSEILLLFIFLNDNSPWVERENFLKTLCHIFVLKNLTRCNVHNSLLDMA